MPPSPSCTGAVLLADDNPVNTLIARTILENAGYKVATAQNGWVALAVMQEQAIDLVLLDCRMPIVDGYTVAETIRAREAATGRTRVPIVAVTGDVSDENKQDCLAAGMDDLLAKPFEPTESTDMVARWQRQASQSAAPEQADDTMADTGAALDLEALELIRDLDETGEVLVRLIGLFLTDAADDLSSMRHGGTAAAQKAAHNIKSSAANMGAMKLVAMCRELETVLEGDDGRDAAVARVEAAFDEVRPMLEQHLERAAAR